MTHDIDVRVFEALGGVDGHQGHFVVVPIILVSIGEQGDVHEEVPHGLDGVRVGRVDRLENSFMPASSSSTFS